MHVVVASAIEQLERARELCRFAWFGEAARDFDDLARSTERAAPDLWVEATFGSAECFRLQNDYRGAVARYEEVLRRYFRLPGWESSSRLVESNRFSAAQSLLSLIAICRLSLRVRTAEIEDLIGEGATWAHRDLGSHSIGDAFRLAELVLERNTRGPLAAARGLRELLREIDRDQHGAGPADVEVVTVRFGETLLDAGQTVYPVRVTPDDHWAYHWTKVSCDLLRARSELLKGRATEARRILDEVVFNGASTGFSEFRLLIPALAAEAADGAKSAVLETYRCAIRLGGIWQAGEMCNVSESLWHLANLILLQIGRGESESLVGDLDELAGHLRLSWLCATLASRGMAPDDLTEAIGWCESRGRGSQWAADGRHWLSELRKAVRP
jgi:hypothetical protein